MIVRYRELPDTQPNMKERLAIENPKRRTSSSKWSAGWYDYYAGYSPGFTKTLLESSRLPPRSVVADPWNGSGTTTEIASLLGFEAHGFDLNPVMLVVAKGRLLRGATHPSILPLAVRISELAGSKNSQIDHNDPLGHWFKPKSIEVIRNFDIAIQELLVDPQEYKPLSSRNLSHQLSDVSAFFYNALFRTVRRLLVSFRGSNPTWIRTAKDGEQRIAINRRRVSAEFIRQVEGMLAALGDVLFCHLEAEYNLAVCSSAALPLADGYCDLILSSPPYCTRIDYAVATLPELSVMGYSRAEVRQLRERLIGTSTISKSEISAKKEWGGTCNEFLNRVSAHNSKASKTYYYKNHLQYFESMFDSLGEVARVLKPNGECILVVQDSYYKDVYNNLPKIMIEMADARNLSLQERKDFRQAHTLAGVNPAVKVYRKTFGAKEAVIQFNRRS